MNLVTGNIWSHYHSADLFLFTANSKIRPSGCLVMGAGVARQVRDKFPGIDKDLGTKILALNASSGEYGLIVPRNAKYKIGAFQTKIEFWQDSRLSLIQKSTDMLIKIAHNYAKIHMPLPGCGNGNLTLEQVLPIISQLPANVTVWQSPDKPIIYSEPKYP